MNCYEFACTDWDTLHITQFCGELGRQSAKKVTKPKSDAVTSADGSMAALWLQQQRLTEQMRGAYRWLALLISLRWCSRRLISLPVCFVSFESNICLLHTNTSARAVGGGGLLASHHLAAARRALRSAATFYIWCGLYCCRAAVLLCTVHTAHCAFTHNNSFVWWHCT